LVLQKKGGEKKKRKPLTNFFNLPPELIEKGGGGRERNEALPVCSKAQVGKGGVPQAFIAEWMTAL